MNHHVESPRISSFVYENIHTLVEDRQKEERHRSRQARLADSVTHFSGTMGFVYVHVIWFAVWILVNERITGIQPFDPYPFGLLTMIVSLEAIFLSTFVLISQNRMQGQAERRSDLDLQINLLAEHEITRLIKLVDGIADALGVREGQDPELDTLKEDINTEELMDEIESSETTTRRP